MKAAVVGYEELTKPFEEATEGDEGGASSNEVAEEEIEDKELDELEKKDLEGLLMMDVDGETEDEEAEEDLGICESIAHYCLPVNQADTHALVYRIEEYIPDALYEQYESFRDSILDWFIRIGLVGKGSKAPSKPSSSDSPRKLYVIFSLSFLITQGRLTTVRRISSSRPSSDIDQRAQSPK